MKRIARLLYDLLLTISVSSVLNWILLIVIVFALFLNITKLFWILVVFILWIENQAISLYIAFTNNDNEVVWTKEDEIILDQMRKDLSEQKRRVVEK